MYIIIYLNKVEKSLYAPLNMGEQWMMQSNSGTCNFADLLIMPASLELPMDSKLTRLASVGYPIHVQNTHYTPKQLIQCLTILIVLFYYSKNGLQLHLFIISQLQKYITECPHSDVKVRSHHHISSIFRTKLMITHKNKCIFHATLKSPRDKSQAISPESRAKTSTLFCYLVSHFS